jgi:hypothetical protein
VKIQAKDGSTMLFLPPLAGEGTKDESESANQAISGKVCTPASIAALCISVRGRMRAK